jgi:pyruvate dehydrogenase E2 component (dihydrolipoamide acetyltransferase)
VSEAAAVAPQVEKAPEPVAAAAPAPAAAVASVSVPTKEAYVHAGPAVRQLARELGIDLSAVAGTGMKGRITREDLTAKIKAQMSGGGAGVGLMADPVVNFADFGAVRIEKTPRIKKISGAALSRNAIRIPHITLFDEADMTELEAFRLAKKPEAEKAGLKLTPVPFLVKAVASALRAQPIVNSALSNDGENLIFKEYVHVGVAVDTPHGLMVPVIRDADQKGLYHIAKELADLSAKAKEGKLAAQDMKGGCFTISSLGGLGTTAFTPIVNMPEVGILGVSRAEMKPKWNGKEFMPRLMLPLSLSLDHRVVDGAEGARFLAHVLKVLGDLRELVL